MECPICFHEKTRFKLLRCEHGFCEKCLEDLLIRHRTPATAPAAESSLKQSAAAGNSNSNSNSNSSNNVYENGVDTDDAQATGRVEQQPSQPLPPPQVECPKCRQISKLDDGGTAGLRTKFFGKLYCLVCDEQKDVDDFRWCVSCSCSVCSRCFIDKHISNDGVASVPHTVCKWDLDYPAVRFCLEQLSLETEKVEQAERNAKAYVRQYLEGLQEFLFVDIEQKHKAKLIELRKQIAQLSSSFGVSPRTIVTAKEAKPYDHHLPDLRRLSGFSSSSSSSAESAASILDCPTEKLFQFTSLAYKTVAQHLVLSSTPKNGLPTCWSSSSSVPNAENLRRKLIGESMLIGDKVLRDPIDFCPVLPTTTTTNDQLIVLIIDQEQGPFLFNRTIGRLSGPHRLAHEKYKCFFSVAPLPAIPGSEDKSFGSLDKSKSQFLLTCKKGPPQKETWVCVLLSVDVENMTVEQVQLKGRDYLETPINHPTFVHSSGQWLFAYVDTTQSMWRFDLEGQVNWMPLYEGKYNDKNCFLIGSAVDGQEVTKILMTNALWQSIDVFRYSWRDHKTWPKQQIDFASIFGDTKAPVFLRPALCQLGNSDQLLIYDSCLKSIYLWNRSTNRVVELVEFAAKFPDKMLYFGNTIFMIVRSVHHNHRDQQKAFHMISL